MTLKIWQDETPRFNGDSTGYVVCQLARQAGSQPFFDVMPSHQIQLFLGVLPCR